MGGINQIINIYSNINRMTDQQKGYGLGIILGIRLPCLRDARAGRGSRRTRSNVRPHDSRVVRQAQRVRRAHTSDSRDVLGTRDSARTHPPLSLSAYHLYIHTTR